MNPDRLAKTISLYDWPSVRHLQLVVRPTQPNWIRFHTAPWVYKS